MNFGNDHDIAENVESSTESMTAFMGYGLHRLIRTPASLALQLMKDEILYKLILSIRCIVRN